MDEKLQIYLDKYLKIGTNIQYIAKRKRGDKIYNFVYKGNNKDLLFFVFHSSYKSESHIDHIKVKYDIKYQDWVANISGFIISLGIIPYVQNIKSRDDAVIIFQENKYLIPDIINIILNYISSEI